MSHPSTLVIGDIHHRTKAVETAIRRQRKEFKQIVFLGDYFDDYGDSPEITRRTCRWLAESLAMPNRIHLLGNHDLAYFFPNHRQTDCPGHTSAKQQVFDEELGDVPVSAFRAAVNIGPWLLSHAGFVASFAQGLSASAIAGKTQQELTRIQSGHSSEILNIGSARGGSDLLGGPFWLDWNREFRPVPGLNQIVGHTPALGALRGKALSQDNTHRAFELYEPSPGPRPHELPQSGTEWTSVNWCLDTDLIILGSIKDGGFDVVVE